MRHSPAEASFYYCERIAPNGSPVRFPTDRALNLNPFEWPAGAKAGTWLIRYCRDAQGRVVIPNTHGKVQVVATLTYPAEVYDQPEGASDDVLMQVLEEKAEEAEDDEEGSLKATRIDAKKREIAIDLTAKEQKLVRRAAVNKELAEGYLLNRAHRMVGLAGVSKYSILILRSFCRSCSTASVSLRSTLTVLMPLWDNTLSMSSVVPPYRSFCVRMVSPDLSNDRTIVEIADMPELVR